MISAQPRDRCRIARMKPMSASRLIASASASGGSVLPSRMKYVLPSRSTGASSVHRVRPMTSRASSHPATGRRIASGTKYSARSMRFQFAPSQASAPDTA